jgi:Ca2+-binding EF-hand superfamily protein
VTTQVRPILRCLFSTLICHLKEYKEAFALFDKKGTGAVPRETLGDLLRALGQNPTQAEVADIVASAPREGKCALASQLWFTPDFIRS